MSEVPKIPEPAPVAGRVRGRRRRAARRWTRRLIELSAALIAATFVAFFSIDIGRFDSLRVEAEERASDYFSRPVHIESITALMWPGRYAVEGFVIEGRNPGDRPFLEADRLEVHLEWGGLLRGELNMEGRMTDWEMVIETWENNTHNLPKFPSAKPPDNETESETEPAAESDGDGGGGFDANVRFVYATRGHFTFLNHDADWSVIAPNLSVDIARAAPLDQLVGNARFSEGTIQILDFLPMSADFTTRFTLDGSLVTLHEIDLQTDGASSILHGYVDFANWPDQRYEIDSDVDFKRMRELFWDDATWEADGDGRFQGFFRMYDGGRELTGDFSSDEAHVVNLAFPNLAGSLTWLRDRFHVTDTSSDFYGGRLNLAYGLESLGQPGGATATLEADYDSVDLGVLGESFVWETLQPEGRASGQVAMTWPNGHFGEGVEGSGETLVAPRGPVVLATAALPSTPHVDRREDEFDGRRPLGRFQTGGRIGYTFDGDGLVFNESWVATPTTYIAFRGHTNGDVADISFDATSYDWQESDRLLAAALTTYGSPTGAVDVGGRGTFNGRLSESFSSPRVEGVFGAEALRAWDVVWGDVTGDIVVEDDYVTVAGGMARSGAESTVAIDGRFALGFHDDDTEEINAAFVFAQWPLEDLRHAFHMDDWPVDGVVADATMALQGQYTGPVGSGRLRIEPGVAWGEDFGSATGDFSFEGSGLLISGITMTKGTGTVTGSAQIDWDGTYSFVADGRRIPVASLNNFQIERTPLTGVMQFSTTGAGRFESPTYEFTLRVPDLFAADEFVGQLSARLTVRDEVLTIDQFQTTSSRLNISGGGSIALNDTSDAQLQFRFFESSLDPYLRFVAPEMSPYTRAIASGSLRVTGPLTDYTRLSGDAVVDQATLTLLDYELRNHDPIRLSFEDNAFRIEQFRLNGQDTALELTGGIDVGEERVDVEASGDASLAILQLFSTDMSTSGAASLSARILGPLSEPSIFGRATIEDGRVRHRAFAHSLTNVNGPIVFDTTGVSLDQLTAQLGEGDVDFGGNIALRGFEVQSFAVSATGRLMRLRYPEGLRSTVNADLELQGTPEAPLISGRVDILQANYQVEFAGNLLSLAGSGVGSTLAPIVPAGPSGFPLAFDIGIFSESLPIIEIPDLTVWATADLRIAGTVDQPSLTGRITLDQGEAFMLGNYLALGGYVEFLDPTRIEPYVDFQVETQVRLPGQTYRITIQMTGLLDGLVPTLTSDPAVGSEVDIMSLLLGEQPDLGSLEQRAIRTPQAAQQQLLRSSVAQFLASPISAALGSVVERVSPVDSVQLMPILGNEGELQQLNPTARVTLGKRFGTRGYFIYSRAFNQRFELLLLEIDQNDRLSWVLSRNEDGTFALDFRLRYVF